MEVTKVAKEMKLKKKKAAFCFLTENSMNERLVWSKRTNPALAFYISIQKMANIILFFAKC